MRILVRQGEGPAAAYQRYHAEQRELEAKVERICAEAIDDTLVVSRATAAGDRRKLRGIPVLARGVSGGVDPLMALLEAERRNAA